MAYPNYLKMFEENLLNQWRERPLTQSPLRTSTIRTVQQESDDKIRREFENYEKHHYVVSNSVYLSMKGVQEAYKSPSERMEFLDNTTSYQPDLSTDRIAIYLKNNNIFQSLYICIHGTKLTSLEDIMQDLQVIENSIQSSPTTLRYILDLLRIRTTYNFIDNDNIYIGGHSLGAVYSLLGSKILKVNGYGFNGAASLINLQLLNRSIDVIGNIYDLRGIENYNNFYSYRLAGDPVSILSKFTLKNVITIDVVGLSDYSVFAKHSLSTMLKICIPLVSLETGSLSRARRSGKIDESRENIKKEGGELIELMENSKNPFSIISM